MPHSIRLRDPWLLENSGSTTVAAASPAAMLTFTRKFNAPTGLTPLQSVLLELKPSPLTLNLSVRLNGQQVNPLGHPPANDGSAENTLENRADCSVENRADQLAHQVPPRDPSLATVPDEAPASTVHFELRQLLQAFNLLHVTIESLSDEQATAPAFHSFCEARLLL